MSSQSEFERLFLLEFFVDYVTLQNTAFNYADSTMCVSFQFLHYPVMRVCEEEFTPKRKSVPSEDSKLVFKSGKSCLFSVHPDENNRLSAAFNLVIAVCQKMKDCDKRMLLGQAAVNLGSSFLNLLQSPPDGAQGCGAGVKHDLFPLKDKFKRVIGSVAAFARLSNFGKVIITQFQLGAEDEMNYMFKGTDPKKLFKDDPMIDFPIIEKETPRLSDVGKQKEQQCRSSPPVKTVKKKIEVDSSSEESDSSDETDSGSSDSSTEKQIGDKVCEEAVEEEEEEEKFKEIAAEVNGNAITIRVLKKNRGRKKIDENDLPAVCCCPPEPPICPNAPNLNVCSCDYPLPEGLMPPRCPPQCCSQPCPCSSPPPIQPKKNRRSLQKRSESLVAGCPREDCPLNLFQSASNVQLV